jgi:hypothetical protein
MVWIRRNVIALAALFVALGGTGYAAFRLPANSVGTRQLRDGAVTDLKVRPHSLTAQALAPGVIPAIPGLKTTVTGMITVTSCPGSGCPVTPAGGSILLQPAICPPGERVLGGGYGIDAESGEVAASSFPTPQGNGWEARVVFTEPHVYGGGDEVSAVCGHVG